MGMRNILLVILVAAVSTVTAHAQIIAIHFDGAAGDVTAATGVVSVNADQWNEVGGASGTVDNLSVTDGTTGSSVNGLDATYFGYDAYLSGNTNLGNLMNGYLDGNGASQGQSDGLITVTLSNIPFANYDVYAYVGADQNGRDSSAYIGDDTLFFSTAAAGATEFSTNSDQTAGNLPVTTLLFTDVSGSSFTYTQNGNNNNSSTGLMALEIVEIPEPGTTGMLLTTVAMLGGLTVLVRRRALLA